MKMNMSGPTTHKYSVAGRSFALFVEPGGGFPAHT
jgi:hypothetical protein